MASIYSNENFPLPTVQDSGQAGSALPDEAVLSSATDQRRILVTFNRKHFIRLHQLNPTHAGIVVCTFDADFVALARRIDEAIAGQQDWAASWFASIGPKQPNTAGHTSYSPPPAPPRHLRYVDNIDPPPRPQHRHRIPRGDRQPRPLANGFFHQIVLAR